MVHGCSEGPLRKNIIMMKLMQAWTRHVQVIDTHVYGNANPNENAKTKTNTNTKGNTEIGVTY